MASRKLLGLKKKDYGFLNELRFYISVSEHDE